MLTSVQLHRCEAHLLVELTSLDARMHADLSFFALWFARRGCPGLILEYGVLVRIDAIDERHRLRVFSARHGRVRQHNHLLPAHDLLLLAVIAAHFDRTVVVQLLLVQLVEIVIWSQSELLLLLDGQGFPDRVRRYTQRADAAGIVACCVMA